MRLTFLPTMVAFVGVAESTTQSSCEVLTSTSYGVDATIVDQDQWYRSIQAKYYTEGNIWSGSQVPVFTTTYSQGGTPALTAYGAVASDILVAEGYQVISSDVLVTDCSKTSEPRPAGTASGSDDGCVPHGDHWHCPEGVPEPTQAPDNDISPPIGTCVPHQDHWHCPEGVAEPKSPPTASEMDARTTTATLQSTGQAFQVTQVTLQVALVASILFLTVMRG